MPSRLPAQSSKFEWGDFALAIKSDEVTLTVADIPELLERLQDMNWPGSYIIADFLPAFGTDLIEPIRGVLTSGDNIWTYWVLSSFKDKFDETFWNMLKSELLAISSSWNEEHSHMQALYILARTKLIPTEVIRLKVREFRLDGRSQTDECDEVDAMLSKIEP